MLVSSRSILRCSKLITMPRQFRLATYSSSVESASYAKNSIRKTKAKDFHDVQKTSEEPNQWDGQPSTNLKTISKSSGLPLDSVELTRTPKSLKQEILQIQSRYENHILLVQVGGFYEIYEYCDYLEEIAHLLGLSIGGKEPRFAGFPVASLNKYVEKLLEAGKTVAIVDQVQRDTMSLSKSFTRNVVRIVTPGTALNEDVEAKENTFLLAINSEARDISVCGLAWLDVCTGEFMVSSCHGSELLAKLARISPREIIVSDKLDPTLMDSLSSKSRSLGFLLTVKPASFFAKSAMGSVADKSGKSIKKSLFGGRATSSNLPVETMKAVEAIMAYVRENFVGIDLHMQPLEPLNENDVMQIDSATLASLEIVKTIRENSKKGSLLHGLDNTKTAAGGRLLARRLKNPSTNITEIKRQLDIVEVFHQNASLLQELRHLLPKFRDVERYLQRMHLGASKPSDFVAVMSAFRTVSQVESLLHAHISATSPEDFPPLKSFKQLMGSLHSFKDLVDRFDNLFSTEKVPAKFSDPGVLSRGLYPELDEIQDELYVLHQKAKSLVTNLSDHYGIRADVKEKIEKDAKVEPLRRQSLISKKKFRHEIKARTDEILETSVAIANLDVASSIAHVARDRMYVRPELTESPVTNIVDGRHPVVEMAQLIRNQTFIPNTVHLSETKHGRQKHVPATMAGCYVPATSARLGIVDRIFSRVGSSDDLGSNQSTFMVEMAETANILHNATPRSLVIMDEVGRGTSTNDGVSLALAIIKQLLHVNKARTIFATHYHELPEHLGTLLKEDVKAIKFVKTLLHAENDGRFSFLYEIREGVANASYGIEVAKLAGE
ncbi:Mismatch repair protein msh3 [Dinochytrium kinnereticum]|nr:Mismatch repair protein msh3 [Dinochytrium kinnereticum]